LLGTPLEELFTAGVPDETPAAATKHSTTASAATAADTATEVRTAAAASPRSSAQTVCPQCQKYKSAISRLISEVKDQLNRSDGLLDWHRHQVWYHERLCQSFTLLKVHAKYNNLQTLTEDDFLAIDCHNFFHDHPQLHKPSPNFDLPSHPIPPLSMADSDPQRSDDAFLAPVAVSLDGLEDQSLDGSGSNTSSEPLQD